MTDDADDLQEPPTGLEMLDDDALLDLALDEDLDITMLERVLREAAREEFADYVSQYMDTLTTDDEPPDDESSRDEDEEVDEDDESDPDLTWNWPISEPPESTGRSSPHFPHEFSGLWLCGYRAGKVNGLPDAERCELLDAFFRERLPSVVAKYHGDDYGDPGTEKRLQKMANVIAANCRNFKRIDRHRFAVAIAEWEADLEYLRQAYHHAGSFPWPPL